MKRRAMGSKPKRAQSFVPVWVLIGASLLVMIALHVAADASWYHLERQTDTLSGGLAGQILEQVMGQGLFMVMAAVVVIVGVPLFLAFLALAASYIAFHGKPLNRSS